MVENIDFMGGSIVWDICLKRNLMDSEMGEPDVRLWKL